MAGEVRQNYKKNIGKHMGINKTKAKKIVLIISLMLFLILLETGCVPHPQKENQMISTIPQEVALEKALEYGGFSKDEVEEVDISLIEKNDRTIYEIKLIADKKDYRYEVGITTGTIMACYENGKSQIGMPPTYHEYIGQTKAREIAFEEGLCKEAEVDFIRTKLIKEIEKPMYVVEYYLKGEKKETFIDAYTGEKIR